MPARLGAWRNMGRKINSEDLVVTEEVSFVNGSSPGDSYHRVVVEKRKRSGRPVYGLHERALNLATTHDGQCFVVGTIPQFPSPSPAPLPIQPKIPPSCRKKCCDSARMTRLSPSIRPADFSRAVLRGGCIRSASAGTIRKGQAQVPLGTNYYRSPRLRLRATQLSFLAHPPCILCKRP